MISYGDKYIQKKLNDDFGPEIIFALMQEDVSEVIVNADGTIWVESSGVKQAQGFIESEQVRRIICTVATLERLSVDVECPDISADLQIELNGNLCSFRFQGVLPPVVSDPVFCIRKPYQHQCSLRQFLLQKVLTCDQYKRIVQAVSDSTNILIAGGTGSGKTTLANAVIQEISEQFPEDRMLVLEDTSEIKCTSHDNLKLQTSPSRSMRDLLKLSMRLRPDRIIVGEVRGAEALDLIKAWNTGHPGGVATVHADSALKALDRLEQLVAESGAGLKRSVIEETMGMIMYIEKDSTIKAGRRVVDVCFP